jgi:hypothetical protein
MSEFDFTRAEVAEQRVRELELQIDSLARFIVEEVPGEPSQSEGAVDTAIRVMRNHLAHRALVRKRLKGILKRIEAALTIEADTRHEPVGMPGLVALGRMRDELSAAKCDGEKLADGEPSLFFAGIDFATDSIVPLDVVFAPEPDASHLVFAECEVDGAGVSAGRWIDRADGLRALRLRVMPGEVKR